MNMKRINALIIGLLIIAGCKKDQPIEQSTPCKPNPRITEVNPVDINSKGVDLLTNMQGQWVGRNQVLAWNFSWFSFDYRAISPSHTLGIYEGGSTGNLLTSFFVTDFKSTRTIMARNGGLLNGIYRSSYFVLDSVRSDSEGDYYRLVDAKGGMAVMYMELRFKVDSLYFNAYTSRLGENSLPTRHMTFKAKKNNSALALAAATHHGYPQNVVEKSFSSGFNESYLYKLPGETKAKSASFLYQQVGNNDVYNLALLSGDPLTILDHTNLDTLRVNLVRNSTTNGKKILLYLSSQSLTNSSGIFQFANFNSILQFPEIAARDNSFRFTYLHRGSYYVTAVVDMDGNGLPSTGDYANVSQQITVNTSSSHQLTLNNINNLN